MDYKKLTIEQLVEECAQRPTPEAWNELIRHTHKLIASVVMRVCRECGKTAPDIIEDLIQDTYLKLCADDRAVLKRFRPLYPNAFFGYLKTITANLVYDHFRRPHPPLVELDPELKLVKDANDGDTLENEILFNKIDAILRQRGNGPQEEKERAIFWLYYRHGMTAKEIASVPGMMTVKGVESCIFRLIAYIRQRIKKKGKGDQRGNLPSESL